VVRVACAGRLDDRGWRAQTLDLNRSQTRTSVSRALAAVDVKDFAGHKAGPFEVENRVHDIRDLAHMAARVQGVELRMRLDGMHRRLVVPGATAFTRIPRFAYSIASDLVAAFRPPFVSGSSTEGT
jgi:hypothetical protein